MGNINLCTSTCKKLSHIEEIAEMTNDFQPRGHQIQESLKFSTLPNTINLNSLMSVLEISKLIFDKINDMRFRPEEYVNEAKQKRYKSIFEEAKNRMEKTGARQSLFLWSDDKYNLLMENDINSLCKNKYNHDDFFVIIDNENISTYATEDVIWKMLDNYDSENLSNFFLKNYNHLVVSSTKNEKELYVTVLFLYKNNE